MAGRFGDYEVLAELGRGGMGTVYKARQDSTGRVVAVKTLDMMMGMSQNARERFLNEARAMAKLRHRNIVTVYEVGEAKGVPFLVMEYVEGKPLSEIIKRKLPGDRRVVTWMIKIAEAVQHAHEHGIIHRDLKPGNVMIDAQGEPVVMDFGLAKDLVANAQLTMTDEIVGTPSYMSPEQVKGAPVDARSDVFSLGSLLYSLLTGEPPFRGPAASVMFQVAEKDPEPPSRLDPDVWPDLEIICLKAMRKLPEERYPTAEALAEDLRAFLGEEPVRARPEGVLTMAFRLCCREKKKAAVGLGCGLAIIITAILLSLGSRKPAGAGGDRLLPGQRFEEAADAYQKVAADAARQDMAKRLLDLRTKGAGTLAGGKRIPVVLRSGARATVCSMDRTATVLADAAGMVAAHAWESLDKNDVYAIYKACVENPTAQDRLGLGALCLVLGMKTEAGREFTEAERLDPATKSVADSLTALQLAR